MNYRSWGFILCVASLMAGCNMAPRIERPTMPLPAHYKEVGAWVKIKPTLAQAQKNREWWTVFHDKTLNSLEQQLTPSSLSLALQYARFAEARALAQAARSREYPYLNLLAGESREQLSKSVANIKPGTDFLYNIASFIGLFSYELDTWGQIHNSVEASVHAARASQYDLATMDLSLHAELAADYFQLRAYDAIQVQLDKLVHAYQHALQLVQHLHAGGAVSALDEDEAVHQLEDAKTAALNNRLQRATLEHAIAVLLGEIPANFSLSPALVQLHFSPLKPEIPTLLLTQRPDIAAKAELVESANATIGIARAAFFPIINLVGTYGYQNQRLSSLFSQQSLIWSLGPPGDLLALRLPEITQVVFDGYLLQANLKRARASYFGMVNAYRLTVLKALQEVEDSLVAMHRLSQEKQTQTASTDAAFRALYQVNQRMVEGMDTYLGVIQIENEARMAQIKLITLQTNYQLATVQFIKAVGGGWKMNDALKFKI